MDTTWRQYGQIDWLFDVDDVHSREDYSVSREDVIRYMENYSARESGATIGDLTNKYSAALFEDYLPSHRHKYLVDPTSRNGHCMWEFDIENPADWEWSWYDYEELLDSYENNIFPSQSSIVKEKVVQMMREYYESKYTKDNLAPFIVLDGNGATEGWESMDAETFGETFYIGKDDRETVQKACIAMAMADKTPVLFRFAVTDYYSSVARFDQIEEGNDHDQNMPLVDGYVAQQSVFLNFRIISFTFFKSGKETVLGVASNPIDIINGIEAPSDMPVYDYDETDWLYVIKMILAIAGLGGLALFVIWLFMWLRKQWNGGNY
jgi:hypothetical protein